MAAGLLASLAPSALSAATDGASHGAEAPATPPENPSPPSPEQQQPWPGLTSKMTPPIYVQLAANDATFTTGNISGAGGGNGQP